MYRVLWLVAFLATGGVKRHPHNNVARRRAAVK